MTARRRSLLPGTANLTGRSSTAAMSLIGPSTALRSTGTTRVSMFEVRASSAAS